MTPREKLQTSYELAFSPVRLNAFWDAVRKQGTATAEQREVLDMAYALQQRLPERGYSSQRALERLAMYQARSRAFGMVSFLRNLRDRVGSTTDVPDVVPAAMVRDIAVTPICRRAAQAKGNG